ncbi:RNA-directed DNA polymerase, eukaryota, Nucleotide-binding alpha-beta plait domain protein [Artemisia annua]|uniref:RNA-directed DNA polymerase, eukaryota, Nucleotide-binding alpha-beta plait domain protein n=1 Tax=Artemisia annua TaxID=35608 RepID=A0A2U1KR99_ARTAN|nr:RNA-directed DNA polymerase, eukaryota, Nucleotide-binding alpha-beta plait domain protein [Artemisia annua]
MGSDSKGSWCKNLKVANEVGFIMIQETQFESLDNVNISRFWGSEDFEFEYVDATGRSGGLISLWNPRIFAKCSVYKDRNILAVSGMIKNDGRKVTCINVYCPQRINDKRMVWDKIRSLVSVDDGFRVVGGDFNSVRDSVERRNSYFNAAETNEFNDFVDDAGLHEFTLKGRKFTYLAGDLKRPLNERIQEDRTSEVCGPTRDET